MPKGIEGAYRSKKEGASEVEGGRQDSLKEKERNRLPRKISFCDAEQRKKKD